MLTTRIILVKNKNVTKKRMGHMQDPFRYNLRLDDILLVYLKGLVIINSGAKSILIK